MKAFDKALLLYEEKFNDIFPMFSMQCTPENEVIDIINKCIKNNKDVYDMGYLTLEDVKY